MLSPRSDVFCDFFTLTVPKDHHDSIIDALQPFFAALGSVRDEVGYRMLNGGLFSWRSRSQIVVYTASGGFVSALREKALLAPFLAEISLYPHNVSSADLTCDEYVEPPERIRSIHALASQGVLSFTRKAITPSHVRSLLRPCVHPNRKTEGDTGTVYIGSRGSHEVHAKVYDKQHQRFLEHGDIIRPTLRHELTVSKRMGITLKDLCQPASCFYHFYPPEILVPVSCSPWVSLQEGYRLEKLPERLPSQLLRQRVEMSYELKDLFELADKVGSEGCTYLLRLIRNAYEGRADTLSASAALL